MHGSTGSPARVRRASLGRCAAAPLLAVLGVALGLVSPARAGVNFSLPTAISPGNLSPGGHLVGDLNGDGHLDVVYSAGGPLFTFPVRSLLADGLGHYTDALAITSTGAGVLQALLDFDGDGVMDLLVRNTVGSEVVWLRRGLGNGTFSAGTTLTAATDPDLAWLEQVRPAKLRAGSLPDLVYATRGNAGTGVPPRLRVLRDTAGVFAFAQSHDLPTAVQGLLVADFDDDGFDDVAASCSDGSLRVFVADRVGGLVPSASLNVGSVAGMMSSADVDADGRRDLFVVADSAAVVKRLLGAGDGSFGAPTTIADTASVVSFTVADADGDGAPDLVTNRFLGGLPPFWTSQLEVHRGFCNGSFVAPVVVTDGDQYFGGPTVADMNEDGLNDLVTVPDNESVAVLTNELPAPTYSQLGGGLAGTSVNGAAASSLDARGALVAGEPFRWTLVDALPFTPAFILLGLSELSLPFKGGTLVPQTHVFIGLPVSASGRAFLGGNFPATPGGLDIVMQYWYFDAGGPVGYAASPGVVGRVP